VSNIVLPSRNSSEIIFTLSNNTNISNPQNPFNFFSIQKFDFPEIGNLTKGRIELIIEGSMDGKKWKQYIFSGQSLSKKISSWHRGRIAHRVFVSCLIFTSYGSPKAIMQNKSNG
jgi:hypothetical protein